MKCVVNYVWIVALLLFIMPRANAQGERKYIRQGNKEYGSGEFSESEILYRKALEKDNQSYAGQFNLSDALYKQDKYEDAAQKFSDLASGETDPKELSRLYHNLGNSLLQSNQVLESIEAYKQALINNPGDYDTKHNLAYALNLLQQQEQQQQQQQENQDQEEQNQDNKQQDSQQNQDEQQEQQQNEEEQQQQEQQQQEEQQQPRDEISEEDARRMLEAIQQDEQLIQEKLKEQKARARRVAVLKDW